MNITYYIPVRKVARSKQKLVLWAVLCYCALYLLLEVAISRGKQLEMEVKANLACLKQYKEKLLAREYYPDPLQHWNLSDGLGITWSHATNTQDKLETALDSPVMMLEADIIMGDIDGKSGIPVMGHPLDAAHLGAPEVDISMEEWLNRVVKTDKGIKLDFKDIDAVEDTLKYLRKILPAATPLMLNADIIAGPGYGQRSPLDSTKFVKVCNQYFPEATLSIGWTTGAFAFLPNMIYDFSMVNKMAEIATSVCQPVTFPVRAILLRKSWHQVNALMKLSSHFTLTVWSAENDLVNVEDLVWLRRQLDKHRIFYDLPEWLERLYRYEIGEEGKSS